MYLFDAQGIQKDRLSDQLVGQFYLDEVPSGTTAISAARNNNNYFFFVHEAVQGRKQVEEKLHSLYAGSLQPTENNAGLLSLGGAEFKGNSDLEKSLYTTAMSLYQDTNNLEHLEEGHEWQREDSGKGAVVHLQPLEQLFNVKTD